MNKKEIWKKILEKQPEFKNPEYVFQQRVKNLRVLMEQAYDLGHKSGRASIDSDPTGENLFRDLFGR